MALTENGVLGLVASKALSSVPTYAIEGDLNARGLSDKNLGAAPIDYSELVNLTLQAERVISW
ncbi:DsrH/TusB family sulfur metabolism protein [Marinobacter similis]|uniref:Multidrug MFS transporter n=1 Tax=Marinobacter similis TaxID=1420916 RepID=W5YMW4_9GAMM|nr:DsrH/TusB family sulfur metabolism protein [Marinobacter similis]AHI27828.1 multidrug MFS transporter [Marinobacter similis]